MKSKNLIIKCPYCGYEYLPCEIFYPDLVFGHSKVITRNEDGNIIFSDGEPMQLSEDYVCDNCNKKFTANVDISFASQESLEEKMFDEDDEDSWLADIK